MIFNDAIGISKLVKSGFRDRLHQITVVKYIGLFTTVHLNNCFYEVTQFPYLNSFLDEISKCLTTTIITGEWVFLSDML